MLKVILEDHGVDEWDWIIHNLAEGDPIKKRDIRTTCRPDKIAETYAMNVYSDSAEYDA